MYPAEVENTDKLARAFVVGFSTIFCYSVWYYFIPSFERLAYNFRKKIQNLKRSLDTKFKLCVTLTQLET